MFNGTFSCFLWLSDLKHPLYLCLYLQWGFARLSFAGAMDCCFSFFKRELKHEPKGANSASVVSNNSTCTESEIMRTGSGLNSKEVSDTSTDSARRPSAPSTLERSSNLRVFSIPELKSATKNFSRSVMLGEGGFGCVYKGLVKSTDDPTKKIEIAVKQLAKRGLQVSYPLPMIN